MLYNSSPKFKEFIVGRPIYEICRPKTRNTTVKQEGVCLVSRCNRVEDDSQPGCFIAYFCSIVLPFINIELLSKTHAHTGYFIQL